MDVKPLPYPHTEHYLKQLDDGRWCDVTVLFETPDQGIVVDAEIHDTMPEFDREQLIYEQPQQ